MDAEVYPGDPEPYLDEVKEIKNGDSCNLTALYTCLHTGTHIDAPLHFIDRAEAIDKIPLELFIGECTVIEAPAGPLTGEYVEDRFPRGKERLLIKGRGAAWFMESGAYAAADAGSRLIGIDRSSVGVSGEQERTHKAFLERGLALLEGLDLTDVTPGEYFLLAQPVKLRGTEASLCRAVLIEGHLFWNGTKF